MLLNNYNSNIKILLIFLVIFLCITGAWLWNEPTSKTPAASASIQSDIVQKSKYKHTRIADIKVGDKVVVSTDDTEKPTSVDPSTWKKLTLYTEEIWQDGTVDTINIETLVPPDWVALNDAQTGSMIPIPLDLEEMGLDQGMLAKVTAISPCPEIRAGPGRVVLTTVNHLNRGVCELTYRSENNQQETIKTTGAHRFYSVDRQKWIHIHDSSPGEHLCCRHLKFSVFPPDCLRKSGVFSASFRKNPGGTGIRGLGTEIITVLSCNPLGTTERVYNMTVEEDHVYHVGQLNLLAHNNGCKLFEEEFSDPADAIGDLQGFAKLVGKGKTKNQDIRNAGYSETVYYRDSNNVKYTVFYNPKTKLYGGAHVSTGQEQD